MTSKHGVKHLFPIPVYWSHVENFVSIQNEITKGIEQTNFGMRKDWGNTHYLSLNDQEITGGTVPITSGGTGAITAGAARTARGSTNPSLA